jgi:hypothetical protein
VRFSLRQILAGTFGIATLIVILEHAGAFSQVLESGSGAYATAFNALTGHSQRRVAATPKARG